jgi:hypothetical protein
MKNKDQILLEQAYSKVHKQTGTELDSEAKNVVYDIEAQKDGYKRFELDYSRGMTFSNNLLALYGIGKRGRNWLTAFEYHGEPMPKEMIIQVLKHVGLSKLISHIPEDYSSEQGFQGSHA